MILLYHRIFPDTQATDDHPAFSRISLDGFKGHIRWVRKHFCFVSLQEYLDQYRKPNPGGKRLAALTFDDGFKQTFDLVFPFLEEEQIAATFFVTTQHLDGGEILWFSYLNALCFENLYDQVDVDQSRFSLESPKSRRQAWNSLMAMARSSCDPAGFCRQLAKSYPLPPKIAKNFFGMTSAQFETASQSRWIDFGAHTVSHPYLDQISDNLQIQEIFESREILQRLSAKPVQYFAYPSGEYCRNTIDFVKDAGYAAAFAVLPKRLSVEPWFEIERTGIYSNALWKLQMKAVGVQHALRWTGLHIGG